MQTNATIRDALYWQRDRLQSPELARRAAYRWIIIPSWIVLMATVILFLSPIVIPTEVQLIPLLLSVIVFGLPHGALDLEVPDRLGHQPSRRWYKLWLTVGYLLLLVGVLAFWYLAPVWGFVFFILLTWWHWGTADLHALLFLQGIELLPNRFARFLTALVRGGLPMLVPLIFFPDVYSSFAASITSLFGLSSIEAIDWLFSTTVRGLLAALLALSISALLLLTYRQVHTRLQQQSWFVLAGETLLLLLFFAIVPPFFGVGIYFCLWHAMRHIARLALLDEPSVVLLARESVWPVYGRFLKQAAPLTAVAIALLAALYAIVPRPPDDLFSLIALV
jgi:beta-carotene 15,15'-dioxygenase